LTPALFRAGGRTARGRDGRGFKKRKEKHMSNNDSTHAAVSNQVIHGDCVQMLRSLNSESIAVITDPPYLGRYRDRSGRTLANDDNPAAVVGVYAELYRVLKPNSFCVTFYGYCKLDAFVHAWTEAGFDTVGHMVWTKPYASSARFVQVMHESAYILAKGRPQKPQAPLPDVQPWEYSGNVAHPTEKAVSILRPLVESFAPAGGVVPAGSQIWSLSGSSSSSCNLLFILILFR
jgi:DNA modification methylase